MSSPYNLLVMSDVHLGSDLVHHVHPEAPLRGRSGEKRDRDLVAMLQWYREHRDDDRPWRLVIAGDLVDFVGMSVSPEAAGLRTRPNREEIEHGLGGAVDHTLMKLELVARHHRTVFEALARFVSAGNSLVIVRGNHDVDLHWESVQREFRRLLGAHAPIRRQDVEFAPWFYYEDGLVYIEHGHQYDPYCSYRYVLHPVSPRDRTRTSRSLSDVLLRHVVRPTRGLREWGHESSGVLDYVRLAIRLGIGGGLALARRFFSAVVVLVAIWRAQFSEAARWVRSEHDRKMKLLGEAKRIGIDRLRALARLQRPPVTRSLALILVSVMLDRIMVGTLGAVLIAVTVPFADSWHAVAFAAAGGLGLLVLPILWSKARHSVDPSEYLRERAPRVARLFPAAFVVMGHTHLPELEVDSETTYVNLGAWAEEEGAEGDCPVRATKTHLVVKRVEGEPVAELLTWSTGDGPRRFETGFESVGDGRGSEEVAG